MNKTFIFILLALGLLATASALGTPVLKKSLYIRDWGRTAYDIFTTKDATISFTTDHPTFHQVDPTYRVLGFSPSSVTEILRNTTQACQNPNHPWAYVDSRLTYSEKTDSLLYFCSLNKSLLVLDSQRYTVKNSIALTFDFPYLGTAKLYAEGDSLVLLLINSGSHRGFVHDFNSTVFIRVNLTSQQVIQNFTLDSGFGPKESVVSYAGNGTTSYLLTNIYYDYYDFPAKNVTVYSFTTNGNSYNVSSLHTETFNFKKSNDDDILNRLYVAGKFVMTTSNGTILVMNSQGGLVTSIQNLTGYHVDANGWKRNPQFFEGRNKTFYYETAGSIMRLTTHGDIVNTTLLLNGTQLQVARGNSQKGDQIFYLQAKATTDDSFWYVYDLDTSKIISQVPQAYQNIFTTNTTYGVLNNRTISLFDWNNDSLLQQIRIEVNKDAKEPYFHDSENSYFYYLRSASLSSTCNLIQVDIRTGVSRNISSVSGGSFCSGRISQINSSSLDFVIEDKTGGYFVNSSTYGQVNFNSTFGTFERGFAAFNFTDLSIHLIHYDLPNPQWSHSIYTFDNRSRAFTKQSSVKIQQFPVIVRSLFTYFGGEKIFVSDSGFFGSIDLSSSIVDTHNIRRRTFVPTRLVGSSGDEQAIIITNKEVAVGLSYIYNQKTYQLDSLPTEQPLALDARATGPCKYYQKNGYSSENVVDIYDVCGSPEKVPFLRKFLRKYEI